MKYEIAVFDLDGTILYTLEDLKNSLNHALKSFGFTERTLEETRIFVGNGVRMLLKRGAPEGTSPETLAEMYEVFAAHYKIHSMDNTGPYDGIPELLRKLRDNGFRTAVVSNKVDFAVADLVKKFYPGLFDAWAGDQEGLRRKPDPDLVNLVMDKLQIPKEKAVYIGDSEVDKLTAENSGMDFIGVAWGFRGRDFLEKEGTECIADVPEDIFKIMTDF